MTVLCALASAALLGLAALVRPTHAACPHGWWLEGVRPSGLFDCRRMPVGDDTWDAIHGERDRSVQPPGVLYGRLYCADRMPIAHWDGRVTCETWQQREARR